MEREIKMKSKYKVMKMINYPDQEITYDINLETDEGFEYVGEFVKKSDAILFCKIKNKQRLKGGRK